MKQIRFVPQDKGTHQFFSTLRSRVDAYFRENQLSRHFNPAMVVKTVIMLAAYILPFFYILFFSPSVPMSYLLWTVMGLALAGIGMGVMHDANHGSYSKNSHVNAWLGYTINLLGGSAFNWKFQHNVLHHTYTNVAGLDDDIEDKLILRFSPHTEVKWYHQFQFIYAFAFYGLQTLYWTFIKDFLQFSKYIRRGVNKNTVQQNRVMFVKMMLAKIAYVLCFLVLPLTWLHLPWKPYVAGFLLMHFVAGFVLTVIFQLAHTVENTTHPLPDDTGNIENNWAIHQMNTTVNFCRHNKLISWYVGGLNFQVEHHLFPNICHVHYPAISKIVRQTAQEFGVPYLENDTFFGAVNSHIKMLRLLGHLRVQSS